MAFLLTVRPVHRIGTRYNPNEPFVPQVGLAYVRGCEVEGMLDEAGKVIEEGLHVLSINLRLRFLLVTYCFNSQGDHWSRKVMEILEDHSPGLESHGKQQRSWKVVENKHNVMHFMEFLQLRWEIP